MTATKPTSWLAESWLAESWLADEHRFWTLAAIFFGALAALKGLRLPSDWVLTQAQVDYSQGFLKRGLTGAVLGHFHLLTRTPLTVVFFAETVLLLFLLALFIRQTRLTRRFGSPAIVAVFTAGYALTFILHLVGYTDIPNAALALLLLLQPRPRVRFALALIVFPIALLIHENFLFLFAPLVLFSFYLDGQQSRVPHASAAPSRMRGMQDRQQSPVPHASAAPPRMRGMQDRQPWLYATILALVAGAITLATSLRAPLTNEQADLMEAAADARANFDVRSDFFQVLSFSLRDNLHTMQQVGWSRFFWWTWFAVSVFVLLPALWLLLHFAKRLRTGALSGRWCHAALLLAVCAPMTLHLIALDCVRWNVWVVFNAFVALGLLSRAQPTPPLTLTPAERHAIILVIGLSMASGWGLFDAARTNPYPFFPRALQPWIDRHEVPLPGLRIPE